jgi:GT2 family glycosyltransferase
MRIRYLAYIGPKPTKRVNLPGDRWLEFEKGKTVDLLETGITDALARDLLRSGLFQLRNQPVIISPKAKPSKRVLMKLDGLVLNILTRTCDRPNRFRRLKESIKAQKWGGKVWHIVSIDRPCDYVDADVIVPALGTIAPNPPDSDQRYRDAPYNLYVNDLLEAVEDGWILILDDDDELLDEKALAALEPYMTDPDKMLVCRFAMNLPRSEKVMVMPVNFGDELVANDVACSCVVFHSKWKHLAKWHGKYCGDFYGMSNLSKKLPVVWVDKVLAGTQHGPGDGSLGATKYTLWTPRKVTVPKKGEPLLSIVIPVMNQAKYTKAILKNISETVHIPYEIIVVDNNSTDETPEILDGCRVIRNQHNAGLSKAWNQGCEEAHGTHIAVLNNDLLLPDGWAETLMAHDKAAICPTYSQGETVPKGFAKKNAQLNAKRKTTRAALPCGDFPQGFAGFCFMLTREAYERTGPFDEQYFYWFGDRDYYHRLNEMGFKCVQSTNVQIHHYVSKTLATCSDFEKVKAREYRTFKARWPDDRLS